MKKSPFVKGAYFIERGVALEETEDDEYEGSVFGSAPPHFSLRSQSAVFSVCKKNLGDVEVFVDLLQAGPDAVEVFFRRNLADGAAFQRAPQAFLEKHHRKDDQ